MAGIVINDAYEQLYDAMLILIQKNASNLEVLKTTIGPGFMFNNLEYLTTCFADKEWFMDNIRGSSDAAGLPGLSSVWEKTNRDIAKTAEILFGAWYAKIVLIAFYTVCLNSVKKRIKKTGKDDSLVDGWLDEPSWGILSSLLSSGHGGDSTEFVIDLRDVDKNDENSYSINVCFDVPDIFYSTPLEDIIAGNINIDTVVFWWGRKNIGCVNNIALKDLGVTVKRYLIDKIL